MRKLHDLLGLRTNPTIFFVSAAILAAFVTTTIMLPQPVERAFKAASNWILTNLGWFYIFGVTTFLLFLLWMALSHFGSVRLGDDDEQPRYSTPVWFAMLFAAGIGTILMFWGVAEPISHFANPPMRDVEPQTADAAREALTFTMYHFALHTWTIFTLPALAFAYFGFKRKLPLRVSSIFHPMLGDRINGPIGRSIDILAVVGTIFGVSVSIGLGTLQVNSGLSRLIGIPENIFTQLLILGVITTIAVISVSLGLDKGIKWLSNINISMAILLLIFVIVVGPTLFLLRGTIEATGTYLSSLVELAFWTDTFGDTGWQGGWTVFYWAWTITWAPFVGIFIARISQGRTIRQFVLGVLMLPTSFSVLWFGVFGLASFDIEFNRGGGLVEEVVEQGDIPGALFAFLQNYPFATAMSLFAIIIVVIFFTTSMDSASLVTDMLCTGEDETGPVRQRVFWAITTGVIAGTLLSVGGGSGLDALQQVIIVVGLPFFIIAFLMMYNLWRALRHDVTPPPALRTRQWVSQMHASPRE
ncbi:BCCT family transporter [Hoyosella rhizosphaerae]|uniref:Multidrug DMT transporter permease n=1 Tax=Hoyosella rhizosphaerae TaxID=1755582 RepID=A0A916XDB0_9ACTN|nr:BCCT family transporter [Hoyosella rhizosphaerae]MBN4926143.1 BCCT family transporter [Hoyosella rhizosphaerae]GGC65202.1 multidrug DMT transporter permease [Hoyosella rhizosphaerae]